MPSASRESGRPVVSGSEPGPALVSRSVGRTLVGMAVPMLAGTFAMNAYHLTDTWFVSRLGTRPLAAMGFTFPVVMMVTCVAGGLGNGLTMLVSHALGRRDHDAARRLTTHGLLLMTAVTLVLSVAGCLAIGPVFRALGVDAETLPLVRDYMLVWFGGALTMSLPHVGNGILISLGDSRAASRLMILGTVLNTILDPIMIFGYLGCPAMGMQGAALATVISQAVAAVWLLLLLGRRHRLLRAPTGAMHGCLSSWRRVMAMGTPSILSMMLMPISASVLTRLLGAFGHEAVAAAGAAGRIEMFAFVIPMALGISLTPFMSQNFGAQRLDRIRRRCAWRRVLPLYGGLVAISSSPSPLDRRPLHPGPEVAAIFTAYPDHRLWVRCSGFSATAVSRSTAAPAALRDGSWHRGAGRRSRSPSSGAWAACVASSRRASSRACRAARWPSSGLPTRCAGPRRTGPRLTVPEGRRTGPSQPASRRRSRLGLAPASRRVVQRILSEAAS